MSLAQQINVYMLPSLVAPEDLVGRSVVVIDVLRATTTIVHALAAGASRVIPCAEVAEARALAANLASRNVLLGGERGGLPIEGFDLGNSPLDYNSETVDGMTIVFTTTNGTRAMLHCRLAREVLLAAFANLSAVCDALYELGDVDLLCAGTGNKITREDVLLAGAITDNLLARVPPAATQLNDQAGLARDAWQTIVHGLGHVPLSERLRASTGGKNMLAIGQESDIDIAAEIDRFDVVPFLDVDQQCIRAR